ncbi:Alpha-galactosidase [Actinomyces bovis]|uniref:Alpha-galactosidase n=1 Tax=Actinomyces bovis TaxID=1658 RepID=A0ABY1VRZ9_9ACTO|nr:glycoside hydrolase family 36 protein [Actinomyces bovis]SPT54441.1 Alpha-galactosidase [Actinomyces bovis]VEG55956.1 Alpha-galactosidase [Actinomyces israelii]
MEASQPQPSLGALRLHFPPDEPAKLSLGGPSTRVPLVECLSLESGRAFVDHRLSRSAAGEALRPTNTRVIAAQAASTQAPIAQPAPAPWPIWEIIQSDATTGLVATTSIAQPTPAAWRLSTTVRNDGVAPIHLTALSSLSVAVLPGCDLGSLDLLTARSAWMAEQRWRHQCLGEELVDIGTAVHGQSARDCLRLSAESGWSSGNWEPVGFITDPATGQCVGWQVEHNGAWTVELSRRTEHLGLSIFGPTDLHHAWQHTLNPGQEFTTPTATLVYSQDGWQGAAVELTNYRRALRAHTAPSTEPAPIVFNDYMNTLMANPTQERLATLIPAAAQAGAEVYCIDDGWHSDAEAWWDAVGEWEPSRRRFPDGLEATLQLIRTHGLGAGLWIEPLAVGVKSPVARSLPASAFMQRAGVRLVEQDRYRLDLRDPAARAHLDAVVDRMMGYGISYLKVDDNYSIGLGTDTNSPGDSLLEHARAWAQWLAELPRRHRGLVVENCASGGMTTDYALLAHARLQSTSDLQDPLRYPPIAANTPLTVLPEQAGNWAYPQPEMSPEEIVFTLTTSLAGSFYLAGHLDRMRPEQLALVRAATDLARELRPALGTEQPWWPAGVAAWEQEWVVAARRASSTSRDGLLLVWHRPGQAPPSSLDLPALAGTTLTQVFPPSRLVPEAGLRVELGPEGPRLTPENHTPTARAYLVRETRTAATKPYEKERS